MVDFFVELYKTKRVHNLILHNLPFINFFLNSKEKCTEGKNQCADLLQLDKTNQYLTSADQLSMSNMSNI